VITIVVSGRNDDYGGDFPSRFFRAWRANLDGLAAAGVSAELLFVEWNPVAGRPLLSRRVLETFANARAIAVPAAVHQRYGGHPSMPFHEMPAKNIGIRHARGVWVLMANADIVFGRDVITWLARGGHDPRALSRAHRIDVPSDVPLNRIEEPGVQLPSGEGATPPCDYLGAGGDFCFASKALWLELGGFDERVRFTTRGKDWQFFLAAAERGVPIRFVGRVYHLDHAGGFRNTSATERDGGAAHFGAWWDIEGAVPIANDPSWGLSSAVFERDAREPRLWRAPADAAWAAEDEHVSAARNAWLGCPAGRPDRVSAAFLHHYLYAAREGRRIVADFVDPSALAALAGFAAVANPYGVETCSRMAQPPVQWPCAPVRFSPALAISPSDLVLTIRDGAVCARVGRREVVSTKLAPAFNPLLARRLLRVWLTLQSEGATAIAIYGAGSHTDEVLQWGLPAGIALKGIVTTPIAGVAPADVDGVVISSATYEMEMCDAARALGFRALPIYSGWPRPFWTVAPAAGLAAACA
jgi:hypothetical protein